MTKIEAIQKIMEDNNGTASLDIIYQNIEKYYPTVQNSNEWEAGIRGVLYREIRDNKRFKKIGLSIYALDDYVEEQKPKKDDVIRMHSYIEGICLEIGNFKSFETYTADPSANYRDNLNLHNIATMNEIPSFSYNEIVQETKRMDVIWFNSRGLYFPQKVFEIIDSIGTLNGAFNRCLQLKNFRTEFFIVAPEQHRNKFNQTMNLETYRESNERFKFINYDEIIDLYDNASRINKIESKIF
ncbi:MAG: hypothetical protein LBT50_01545 [Prevotellaceae bacterium]|jgi:hypothetical protein|nr:hypothetical protein [Prevotellaceae bacterium]